MADGRRATGQRGEQAACDLLVSQGYEMLARNWRCRSGEIDLVMTCGDTIVFVEVRTRREGGRFGTAAESVDARKQMKLRTLAGICLKQLRLGGSPVRFDVVAVTLGRNDDITGMTHYAGAF